MSSEEVNKDGQDTASATTSYAGEFAAAQAASKVEAFDTLCAKLETVGFDTTSITHSDIAALLIEITQGGTDAISARVISETSALRVRTQQQFDEFSAATTELLAKTQQQFDEFRARTELLMATLPELPTQLSDTKAVLTQVEARSLQSHASIQSLEFRTRDVLGTESSICMQALRELSTVLDVQSWQFTGDAQQTRMHVSSVTVPWTLKPLLKSFYFLTKKLAREENWDGI